MPKPKRKLRFRIGAFSSHNSNQDKSKTATAHASSLGLVEGNSTNTVNTVEDVDQDNSTNNASNASDTTTTPHSKQMHQHGGSGKKVNAGSSNNGGTEVTAFNSNMMVDEVSIFLYSYLSLNSELNEIDDLYLLN